MMASAANRRIRRLSYAKYGYMFILPFFLVYFVFSLYPLLYTFYISTFCATGTAVDAEMYYVGFENFKDLLFIDSPVRVQFFQAIGNTLILWICNFIPQIALSLLLAVWFTDNRLHVPGKGFFKVVMYMPNIITAASVATLFLSLFGETQYNPVNQILLSWGWIQEPITFLQTYQIKRGLVSFILAWMWFGNTMVMLMASIMGINPSLFEAAQIDGANSAQVFAHITVPSIRPMLVYVFITSMIGGLQMFDVPYLFNVGTDVDKYTRTIAIYIFERYSGATRDYGRSAAASIILFIITGILGAIVFYINSDKDEIAEKKRRRKEAKRLKGGAGF